MANPNNWKQYSEPKPEFTDYTMAPANDASLQLRFDYEHEREFIKLRQDHFNAATCNDHRTVKVRCGYPTKRERDENKPSKRHVPHSKFLKQFKIIERLVGTGMGDLVWVAKVYVLHATRGWKLYA